MYLFVLLIPAIMFIIGLVWVSNPPKNINSLYGYRTKRSMRSQETWDFAHRLTSKIWLITGLIMGILSIIVFNAFENKDTGRVVIAFIQIAIMMSTIIPVEIILKVKFDKYGNPK